MKKCITAGPRPFQGTKPRRNVVLNYGYAAGREFGPYGRAFHQAGRSLAKLFLEKQGFSDFECVPIVYLYRHSLELHLKGIILAGNRLMELDGEGLSDTQLWELLNGHRLSSLLPQVQNIFRYVDWGTNIDHGPIKTFADIQAVVADLESVDPSSFTFRYPTDKKGKDSLEHPFGFCVHNFVTIMDPLVHLLGNSVGALEDYWDNYCESLSEASRE
jgi:hypothetical protein